MNGVGNSYLNEDGQDVEAVEAHCKGAGVFRFGDAVAQGPGALAEKDRRGRIDDHESAHQRVNTAAFENHFAVCLVLLAEIAEESGGVYKDAFVNIQENVAVRILHPPGSRC